MDIRTQFNCW